jgi:hypothetical protein
MTYSCGAVLVRVVAFTEKVPMRLIGLAVVLALSLLFVACSR